MRILAIDVGTGTQDILLFDSEQDIENCPQMIMPSPTAVVAGRVRAATARREPLLLTGVTMGGGPSHWATMDHIRSGLPVYATPVAAQTFDDDLEQIREMGIQVVSVDEAAGLTGVCHVEMRDLYVDAVQSALAAFGADPSFDALAVAVFDHGAAPPGYSDRKFRFDYLGERMARSRDVAALAFGRDDVPAEMTRLKAVGDCVDGNLPLLLMDTAPAAVLGALDDPNVGTASNAVAVNVGNFHCLAFRLEGGLVTGLFEHHTGELERTELERYVERLAAGTITNQEVFDDMGHGALLIGEPGALRGHRVAVTGPRRGLLNESMLRPYAAVPHGDMMLAGCFGLLRGYAWRFPEGAEAIERRLGPRPRP
ncbi:MAG: DUF1786 domain-containing protein [Chloroflexota bacterium]